MTTYEDLVKQRDALELQIAEARRKESGDAISKIRAMVVQFGLTEQDVFPVAKKSAGASKGTKVAAKYRNPATGETWTGRGKPPKWIAGQDRAKYTLP